MIKPVVVLCVLLLAGCQTPQDLRTLQQHNGALEQQLSQANRQISQLETDKTTLQQDIAELNRVLDVLGQEKSSRVTESTNLRGEVRLFVQQQVDFFKQFLLDSNLLDYIGGELVERSNIDGRPLLIVDLFNSVPRNGTLTGVGGYFHNTGSVAVKVIRSIAGNLVVVWSSPAIEVADRGLQRLSFPVSVSVEKGDYLAYHFSQPGLVSFDTGTGDARYLAENIAVGSVIKLSSLQAEKEKRAYAVGVFGLLNAQ